jgi:hypothetical protein
MTSESGRQAMRKSWEAAGPRRGLFGLCGQMGVVIIRQQNLQKKGDKNINIL